MILTESLVTLETISIVIPEFIVKQTAFTERVIL
jgi:hypothetical protein